MAKMKTVMVLLVVILAGFTLGAFLGMTPSNTQRARSMKPPKLSNLSEYGLSIIDQSDPSFDGRLLASLGNDSGRLNDLLKRFSIFVVNNSQRAVAALAVHWEFTQADGQTISKYKAVHQFNLFGNNISFILGSASGAVPPLGSHPVIEPHSSHLFSLMDTGGIETNSMGSGGGAFRADNRSSQVQDRTDTPDGIQQRVQKYAELQATDLVRLLEKSVSWSVSIDGAFFEDGTFVGPDKKGFFEKVKAEQDAISDLLMEIEKVAANPKGGQGATQDEAFNYLQSLAGPDAPRFSMATATDAYQYSKAFCAKQILEIRNHLGDEKLMSILREEVKKPRIKLVKQ